MGRDERRAPLETPVWEASYTDTLYLFLGSRGIGGGVLKITLIVFWLECLTRLLLFTTVEFEKLPYSPDLKMVLIFPVAKIFQKGAMFK